MMSSILFNPLNALNDQGNEICGAIDVDHSRTSRERVTLQSIVSKQIFIEVRYVWVGASVVDRATLKRSIHNASLHVYTQVVVEILAVLFFLHFTSQITVGSLT